MWKFTRKEFTSFRTENPYIYTYKIFFLYAWIHNIIECLWKIIKLILLYTAINDDTLYPPGNDELKEDQWLGVSVSSSSNDTKGGHIVVCAHRYALRPNPDSIWGQGLCYTLMQDFQPDEIWEPCRGKSVRGLVEYIYGTWF